MKDFIRYLRFRRGVILLFLIFALVFLVTFILYGFPLASVLYPAVICAVIGCIASALDYDRVISRHRKLEQAAQSSADSPLILPDRLDLNDEDWRKLVDKLCSDSREAATASRAGYNDMIDYYTVWAHQIKTPIAAMRLTLSSEDSELSRRLSSDLRRIEAYVGMVLAFLRLGSESTDYVIREYSLDDILRPAIKRFAGDFISKKLSLDYSPSDIRVLTDEKWLSFVIEQLLSNAIKYSPSGTVSIYTENGSTLCIKDCGIGIAPEDLPRIFDKGYTGLNGRADMRASGIGLYLCKTVCDRLGHKLSAESVIGEGSIFRIELGRRRLSFE